MYVSQRTLLYPGASWGSGVPPASPAWGASAIIETADGERLHALHAPARERRPTILFFLGNADRIDHYGFLAEALAERGIGLLAISYRGYGGSTGRPSEAGLISDGMAAFDWLARRSDGGIVLLGQSLGSGVAVAVAAERPARGVILLSSYDSILALARAHYPFLPVGPLLKDRFRSDLRIGRVAQPKLFLHGRHDRIVPLRHGEALFELAPEPKEMVRLDGFGHNDIWGRTLIDLIAEFVDGLA